jgi:hypothetical protein
MIHAWSAAAAPRSRTISWSGIRYRMNGPQDIVVEARSDPT